MATYPLATLAATITANGITAPAFADVLASLKASFQGIYGDDAYLEPDSQDGQLLAIFAAAIHDCNQTAIAAYNAFSPATAVGAGLSNVVKINHMQRLVATNSQVNVTVTGVAGTTLTNAAVADAEGKKWLLPGLVVIPNTGSVLVTATAEKVGALLAPIGTVTKILTPVAGWQAVTNPTAATPGQPVESDAALRTRQQLSPATNSYTVLQGMSAALLKLTGVTYGTIYENDTNSTDTNGLPAHSISVVVAGGDATQIAQTIYDRKAPGVATYGSTTIPITDISGAVRNINFSVPTEVAIKVGVSITAGVGYTSAIGDAIKAAVVAYINGLDIGEDLIVNRLTVPALLNGIPTSETYRLGTVQAALSPSGTLGTSDIVIAFTSKATCVTSAVTLTLL